MYERVRHMALTSPAQIFHYSGKINLVVGKAYRIQMPGATGFKDVVHRHVVYPSSIARLP